MKKDYIYSAVTGYYSHVEGARYINPMHNGASFSELVEIHEAQHSHLALNNITDGVASLFSTIMTAFEKKLNKADADSILNLLKVVHENSVYTHEVVATYVSFIIFNLKHPEKIAEARKQLPSFYSIALEDAEKSFGKIEQIKPATITIVFSCAIAALSDPQFLNYPGLKLLNNYINLFAANSPDERFKLILKSVKPYWNPDSIFFGLNPTKINVLDSFQISHGQLQQEVFARLRKAMPEVPFLLITNIRDFLTRF